MIANPPGRLTEERAYPALRKDEEQRKEILHLFSTFHSPFVEILESLKDEETEEEA